MSLDPTKTPPPSFGDIMGANPIEVNQYKAAGRSVAFDPSKADRYLTYGSKAYGQLGYNPYRDNDKLYVKNTPWTKDISRGFQGMMKLAGVGLSDSFAFGAFGSTENHKDFGKIMADYSSSESRGGATKFLANTMISSGYTVGIIGAVAAEELALAGATVLTGGLAGAATLPAMGATAARAGLLLSRAGKAISKVDDTIGILGKVKNIDDARWFTKSAAGFGKALMPLGNTADYLRLYKTGQKGVDAVADASRFKDLNGLTKTLMGAGALARDARKIYLSHSESKLEADFVKDEIITAETKKWQSHNFGKPIPTEVTEHIRNKANQAYNKTYSNNFGLIYLTNAITFDGLFRGFSPTNRLFKMVDNFHVKNLGKTNVSVEAAIPSIKNYLRQKASSVTIPGTIKKVVGASMEGVQEYGQDVISSAAKKYAEIKYIGEEQLTNWKGEKQFDAEGKAIMVGGTMVTDDHADMSKGAYFSQVANSLGDSSWETFASGALMGTFAAPVNLATQAVSEYTFGEKGFGSEYNEWTEEGRKNKAALWESREREAVIMTEALRKTGATLTSQLDNPVFEMTGLREKMLKAAREGDKKFFEDNKAQVFRLGLRTLLKNGMHTELVDHLKDMKNYTSDELNQSLDRVDITDENKAEYLDKIDKRIEDIQSLKEKFDDIEYNMPSIGSVNKVLRDENLTPEEKQAAIIEITAWDELKKEMLFTGDKIKNLKERKAGIISDLKANTKLTDLDTAALTNINDLSEQISLLEDLVKSNVEYKLDKTRDHQKAEIKLKGLLMMRSGMEKLNDPNFDKTNEKALTRLHDQMQKGFGLFMLATNTELNEMPNASSALSDKRLYARHIQKFEALFDYYQLNEEGKSLEEYADTLADPKSQTKWLRANKEFLLSIEDNKKEYIKDAIEKFQQRTTADSIISDLLENGMAFELDELDDLFDKQIIPTRIFDIATGEEVNDEQYQIAIKIFNARYKNLTGKKLTGIKKGIRQSRLKSKNDKRKASTLINVFAGRNKKDVPITIEDFIDNLLNKGNLTKTERAILGKLKSVGLNQGTVILTDQSDMPIAFNEAGDLVIDVRFAGYDYEFANIPFEYLAVSGLMQNILAEKIKTNETFDIEIRALMGDALQAQINSIETKFASDPERAKNAIAQARTSEIFTNPLVFITEAFANKSFQAFLNQTASLSDIGASRPIWKDVYLSLQTELEEQEDGIFSKTILSQALSIATLNLSESVIAQVADSPTIEEQEQEQEQEQQTPTEEEEIPVVEEEEAPVVLSSTPSTLTQQERDNEISYLELEVKKLKRDRAVLLNNRNKLNRVLKRNSIRKLNLEIEDLDEKIDGLLAKIKSYSPTITTINDVVPIVDTNQESTTEGDENGNLVVNGNTEFTSLSPELQFNLATYYYVNDKPRTDRIGTGGYAVDNSKKEEFLDNLTEEDIAEIELRMKNLIGYKNIIIAYNRKANAAVKVDDAQQEDDETIITFSSESARILIEINEEAKANITAVDKDDDTQPTGTGKFFTVFDNHKGESIEKFGNTKEQLEAWIDANYSITGWANNDSNIVEKTFKMKVGDVATDVDIRIEAVKLLVDGSYYILATRKDNGKVYEMNVAPSGYVRSYSRDGGVSITADRTDIIYFDTDGFTHYVVPIGTAVEEKPVTPTTNRFIIQTVDDLKSILTAEEVSLFTEEELDFWAQTLGYAVDMDNFKVLVDSLNSEIEKRLAESTTTSTDIEAKKADIEKRRKETLSQIYPVEEIGYDGEKITVYKNKQFGEEDFWVSENQLKAYIKNLYDAELDALGQPVSKVPVVFDFSSQQEGQDDQENKTKIENATESIKDNWEYLNRPAHMYKGTNAKREKKYKSGWSLNKKDRSYLLAYRISDFNNSRIDFENAVLDWLESTNRRAEGIKGFDAVNSTVTEVENWVRGQMNMAVNDKELSTAVINILNKKLTQGKSKLFIANKRQGYVLTTRTKAQQSVKVSSNAELFEKVRERFYPDSSLNMISEEQAMYLVYEALRTEKINPILIANNIARGEESLYSALTSLKSKFTTVDGFADKVFSGDYSDKLPDNLSGANIVIEVLKLGRTLSDIRDYFVDEYLREIKAEIRAIEDRAAAEKAMEDELNEAIDNYLSSKEFTQYVADFESSIMGQLLNNTYQGTRDQLKTDVEKRTFDEMGYGEVSEKNKSEDEDEDFGPKNTLTPIQEKVVAFMQNNPALRNAISSDLQNAALRNLISDDLSFEDMAIIYQLSLNNLLNHSVAQNKAIMDLILNHLSAFGNIIYPNAAVSLNEFDNVPIGIYIILPISTNTSNEISIKIQNLETNETYKVQPSSLLSALVDVLKADTLIENKSIDFTATNATVDNAMTSISDIFSNFKEGIDEFQDLQEEDLMSKIVNTIKNCNL